MDTIARGPFPPRRSVLLAAGALLLTPGHALALRGPPAGRRLAFAVYRNGTKVGEHRMSFTGAPGALSVSTDVNMTVKLGPVPVYRYSHSATERWAGGQFASLQSTTNGNGKVQKVNATRTPSGVIIESTRGKVTAPAAALPLTHWNSESLTGPLFNPQEGKVLKVQARRMGRETIAGVSATRWNLTGEAQIDNWYDPAGDWLALKGKLEDGSLLEYRRL